MTEDQCFPIKLPQMGEGVFEATLIKWLKKEGSLVKEGEPIVEVATDKVDTEITSSAGGYLNKILKNEGETISIQETMAIVTTSLDTKIPQELIRNNRENSSLNQKESIDTSKSAEKHSPQILISQGHYSGHIRSSPLVQKMSKEFQINLGKIIGTGLHGRVTKEDLLSYMSMHSKPANKQTASHGLKTSWHNEKEFLDGVAVKREKMSGIRKLTAEHMTHSVKTSAHVTTTFEIDCENISQAKANLGKSFKQETQLKLTFTPFFILAAIEALKEFPVVNCSLDGEDLLLKEDINVGCAVAIDSGLVVPVIRNANFLGLSEIATQVADLSKRARKKKLQAAELKGGTFTVTNPGMFGSLHSQPIINQPQVAIMNIGAIIKRPVVCNGKDIEIHPMCQIGLTFDHRVIDGEGGAKFLAKVKNFLENHPFEV